MVPYERAYPRTSERVSGGLVFKIEQTALVWPDRRSQESGGLLLIGENKERWRVLCEQAAVEQDPEKLHKLVTEINRLLEEKEARLKDKTPPKAGG
jgi:hypothetical protein